MRVIALCMAMFFLEVTDGEYVKNLLEEGSNVMMFLAVWAFIGDIIAFFRGGP